MSIAFYKYINPFEPLPCYMKVCDDAYFTWSKSKLKWQYGFYNSWKYFTKRRTKDEQILSVTELEIIIALGAEAIES